MEDAGVYQFQVKGAVSMLFMFPEKKHEEYVFIEVINPCLETVINSDGRLKIDLLDVPLGEEQAVYKFDAPNDKVSL